MSIRTTDARKVLAVAGLTAVAFGAAASSAMADTSTTLQLSCDFPLVGESLISAKVDTTIPTSWTAGKPTPAFKVNVTATSQPNADGDDTAFTGLKLVKVAKLQGTANATSTITSPGFSKQVTVPIAVPSYATPAAPPLVLGASGETPSVTFPQPGAGQITVDAINLNLAAFRADGTPVTQLSAAQSYPDSDGDPKTFDAPCKVVDPSKNVLAKVTIAPGPNTTPTPPAPTPPVPTPPAPTPTPTPAGTVTVDPSQKHQKVKLTCDFPLVGQSRFDAELDLGFPKSFPSGKDTPRYDVTLSQISQETDGTDNAYTLFKLVKASEVGGTATIKTTITGGGVSLPVDFATDTPQKAIPANPPLTFDGKGKSPKFNFPKPGALKIQVDSVALNLRANKTIGGDPITQLSSAQSYPDSDHDPNTFDAPCTVVGSTPTPTPPTPTPPVPTPTPTPVKGIRLSCDFPLVGQAFVDADIKTTIPSSIPANTVTPQYDVNVNAVTVADESGTDTAYTGLRLVSAAKVGGVAQASTTVNAPGFSLPIRVPVALATTPVPSTPPLELKGSGKTPQVKFPKAGTATISLDAVDLNLAATRADGSPITALSASQVYPDSDGDPKTFDAPCTVVGGPKTIKTVKITGAPSPAPKVNFVYGSATAGVGGFGIIGGDLAGVTKVTVGGKTAKFQALGGIDLVWFPALPAGTYPVVVTNAGGSTTAPTKITYSVSK